MTERDDPSQRRPMHRLRLDESAPKQASAAPTTTHSGRRLVLAAGLVLILVWGTLQVLFLTWRSGYRERAAFGASQVAPVVDPLADVVPPAVDPAAWRRAVAETHEAVVALTASNVLDRPQMEALRADLTDRVARARAHPETARAELADLWNDLADRAGPVLAARHPRPELLPPRVSTAGRRGQGENGASSPSKQPGR